MQSEHPKQFTICTQMNNDQGYKEYQLWHADSENNEEEDRIYRWKYSSIRDDDELHFGHWRLNELH